MMNGLILYRKLKGLTQLQVAECLNVSLNTYTNYEHGRKDITSKSLLKLAKLYEISVDMLLNNNIDINKTNKSILIQKINGKITMLSEENLTKLDGYVLGLLENNKKDK